jgi:hypothetical protein
MKLPGPVSRPPGHAVSLFGLPKQPDPNFPRTVRIENAFQAM